MSPPLTRVFINDIEVFVPPNTTVLEAAEKVGVQVRRSKMAFIPGAAPPSMYWVRLLTRGGSAAPSILTTHRCPVSATTRPCPSRVTAACAW
jgi:hypothetical protein